LSTKVLELGGEKRLLEMRLEDFKNRQSELSLKLNTDQVIESHKCMELEHQKTRAAELETAVRELKEELYRLRGEKEKLANRNETLMNDNQQVREECFALKKLILQMEKKDILQSNFLNQKFEVIEQQARNVEVQTPTPKPEFKASQSVKQMTPAVRREAVELKKTVKPVVMTTKVASNQQSDGLNSARARGSSSQVQPRLSNILTWDKPYTSSSNHGNCRMKARVRRPALQELSHETK